MLQIHFLGSGSQGNATLIRYAQTHVLVDCGFSGKELNHRMQCVGVNPDHVSAVLITHEHNDHVKGLAALAKQNQRTIYCTKKTSQAVYFGTKPRCKKQFIAPGQSFLIDQIEIHPFPISHDARQPVGFVFRFPDRVRLGLATDLGHPNRETLQALYDCDFLALESNHDPHMLRNGPYPYFLKQRIFSKRGHLSNETAAQTLNQLKTNRLRRVFAMHLSQTNNKPALAQQALGAVLDTAQVTVISQDKPYSYPQTKTAGQLNLF